MPSLNEVLAVILGGGRGSRLYPLTAERSKPAVPIAGKYRLIDVPISNCINSGLYRVAVLTQFNSVSLHRHIANTYQFDSFHQGWVQIWAAEQTVESTDWYQGTADAVRKQRFEIQSTRAKDILILAGDHLYRMDYAAMAQFHWENRADITVAVQPVPKTEAGRFGLLKRGEDGRILNFAEKPKDPALLQEMVSRDDPERPYLGSMGIYMFRTDVLLEMLNDPSLEDFGQHIIPSAIQNKEVYGFDYDGFWEDIGTMRSFYDANLMLTQPSPPFNFYDPKKPIYTHPRFLPGTKVQNSQLENVLLAEGGYIKDSVVRRSIIGLRSQIFSNVTLIDTVMMGADYYEDRMPAGVDIPIGIGHNSWIEGAIVDKNARIGSHVIIKPFQPGVDVDGDGWVVRDGIVVIRKNAVIPAGTHIAPGEIG
ncbi:glucose-1-phosphate adenylyltransferase [Levilinea saccharolytica]|uniref:Glucose-1-phosphate adenylyltransferase n=1 Tax=Levilinea saccharolytica TaxID=229921 RepID=A0A0P6XJZ8_9CHLR|nr:glucose-1-phosphate adenylyltransferase [Levilinea saccharolytica]KPL80501.1 glucose-1-phosphate adenylyltransferase [Levilinea saccharolytica]GAP16232.1 glucose-1-phosphate adenylyltransferase [Levilinea saccharolytica]